MKAQGRGKGELFSTGGYGLKANMEVSEPSLSRHLLLPNFL